MEYAPAESLLQALKRGPMAWDRVVRIGEQISAALARAHEAGVIHRDLKPENVLFLDPPPNAVDRTGDRVKLTDFGIAKIVDAPALTFSEQMFGTPGYIAPEYVEGVKADGRADLFSLGVLLYESMTGTLPWDAKGQAELLLRPLTAAPTPLSERIEVPPELDSLVLSLLAKKPGRSPARRVRRARRAARRAPALRAVALGARRRRRRTGRDEIPTTVTEIAQVEERPPMSTADIGRVQTSELASRWGGAIADIETQLARARKKGIAETTAMRAAELTSHARTLVDKLERASTTGRRECKGASTDCRPTRASSARTSVTPSTSSDAIARASDRTGARSATRHDELEVELVVRGVAARSEQCGRLRRSPRKKST